jgi:hypothetical protein
MKSNTSTIMRSGSIRTTPIIIVIATARLRKPDRGVNWDSAQPAHHPFYDVTTELRAVLQRLAARRIFSIGGPRAHAALRALLTPTGCYEWRHGFHSQVDPEARTPSMRRSRTGARTLRPDDRRTHGNSIRSRTRRAAEVELDCLHHQPAFHTRLYFAADKLFRSDDRGDSCAISGQLSCSLDRDKLR